MTPSEPQTKINSSSKKRLPSLRRVPDGDQPPLRLTERDQAIIRSVYEYRALSTVQIDRLIFRRPGALSSETYRTRCAARLQRLYHHEFLQRRAQLTTLDQGRKPYLYFLDRRGRNYLASLDDRDIAELDWHPRDNAINHEFINHLLHTNDVRITIMLACQLHGWKITSWEDDKSLRQTATRTYVAVRGRNNQLRPVPLVPDGSFRITKQTISSWNSFHSLLEVDMGTMAASRFGQKVPVYLEYYNGPKKLDSKKVKNKVLTSHAKTI